MDPTGLIAWGALLALTAFSALLALAENAALGLTQPQLAGLARTHDRIARRLRRMREHRFGLWVGSRFMASLIILASACIAATAIADGIGEVLQSRSRGAVAALLLLAVLHSFGARVIPRLLARRRPIAVARAFWWLLYAQYLAFLPASRAYERRLSPEEHQAWREPAAGDAAVIEAVEQAPAGAIDATDVKMITNVIELGDRTVRQVMTPRPDMIAVAVETPLVQALRIADTHGLSRLPVYDNDLDNIIGVLHVREGIAKVLDDTPPPPLRTLARPPLVVPDSKFVDRLLREMQAAQVHLAIVLNEYGDTAGLVTIEDLLEEIVGEIEDEYDTADTPIERLRPGQVRVAASLPIDTLNAELGLALSVDDMHTTVGGLAFSAFGRIPDIGEAVTVDGVRLRVLALRDTRITRLEVTRVGPTDA